MKNIFLITVLMMSFNFKVQAQDMPGPESSNKGQKSKACNKDELNKLAPAYSDQGNDVSYPGSRNFNACDKLSRGRLKDLYKNGSRSETIKDWEPYAKYACADKCDSEKDFKSCTDQNLALARKCESVTYVMSFYDRDWSDSEQIQQVSASSNGNGNGQQMQNSNGNATQAAAATSGSTFKCKSEGIETLDYIACKKFATQIDIIDAVQTAAQSAQELVYADKSMDASTKFAKEENTATGALKATGESLENQQSMYQQRTAVDATKLAYMYSIYNEMPKLDDMRAKCDGIDKQTANVKGLPTPVSASDCRMYVLPGATGGFAMAQNQSQIDAMRSKLITIATSTGSNAILASLLGKRASDVKKAIAEIDAFVPTDPTVVSEDDALATYCKLNPGVEKCLTADLTKTFDTLNDNVITFGDGGTGTSYGSGSGITVGAVSDSGTDATSRTPVTGVGSVIAAAAQDNSIEGSSAATVSGAKAPSGGGGGGSGGGASGGGGGGGTPAAPAQGGVAAAVQGKTPTYGGGAGSISVVGGLGLNKAKGDGKGEDNPFGKLFGKDTPKGSGVVNFRDIASAKVGAKGDNLFDMISKRYSSVAADKRLLEYELTK